LEENLAQLNRWALRAPSADPYQEAVAAGGSLQARFQSAGIEFRGVLVASGTAGARVFLPATELRRIVHDLLFNSIEACEHSAEPTLGVRIAYGEQKVILHVEDNGKGVSPHDQQRIFEGYSTKEPPGGTGLSHARRIVEAYSGRILVRQSMPWTRTVFEIELYRATSSSKV
jgi:signal transduction histidine kinase